MVLVVGAIGVALALRGDEELVSAEPPTSTTSPEFLNCIDDLTNFVDRFTQGDTSVLLAYGENDDRRQALLTISSNFNTNRPKYGVEKAREVAGDEIFNACWNYIAEPTTTVSVMPSITISAQDEGVDRESWANTSETTRRPTTTTSTMAPAAPTGGISHRVRFDDVRMRAAPEVTSAEGPTRLQTGDTVVVVCWIWGTHYEVPPDADLAANTSLWNRLDNGFYVADYFLDTVKYRPPEADPWNDPPGPDPSIPQC